MTRIVFVDANEVAVPLAELDSEGPLPQQGDRVLFAVGSTAYQGTVQERVFGYLPPTAWEAVYSATGTPRLHVKVKLTDITTIRQDNPEV